jgi:Ras GTPase-activating-like protein IQGAP1
LASTRGANIEDIIEANSTKYLNAMRQMLSDKRRTTTSGEEWLNHGCLQEAVDSVNNAGVAGYDYLRIEAVHKVNEAVDKCDAPRLRAALLNPDLRLLDDLKLKDVSLINDLMSIGDDDAIHLLCLLRDLKANRSLAEAEECELWMDHIVESVATGLAHGREAKRAGTALAIVNMAVMQGDARHTFQTLLHDDLNLESSSLHESYQEMYQVELQALAASKENDRSPWVVHSLKDGDKVYVNLHAHTSAWRTPSDYRLRSCYINVSDLENVIESVNSQLAGRNKFEAVVTKLQARIRGYIIRQRLFSMLEHYYKNEASLVKIQSLWRGRQVRKKYATELRLMSRHRFRPLAFFQKHLDKITLIQRVWRSLMAKKEFRKLLLANGGDRVIKTMDVPTVRKFLHLLDMRPDDFKQELELQALKGEITQKIRMIGGLEKDLDTMDIKIGLLVKNRIDVEDVVAHGKHLSRGRRRINKPSSNTATPSTGLKALKKESRAKLEAYQHLFYQLQTDPTYLAKLIFVLQSTKFLDSVILTLYNFGANQREEYLLLKLFKTALEEEIRSKVDRMSDIVAGNPLVIKMAVGFYKSGGQGQAALKDCLGPIIQRIVEDKKLSINTNPVEIYKAWINSKEVESGVACGLPYNVSLEEALRYD